MSKSKNRNNGLTVRVKTSRGRTLSSTMWLQRQLNDPYVHNAKKEGYKSRAAYKLLEIHEKYKLIKAGDVVVDLGSTPGGWTQVALKFINSGKKGKVIAIDLNPMDEIVGADFILGDFLEDTVKEKIKEVAKKKKVNIVLSDMAAQSCGHSKTDHIRIMNLCEEAFYFATEMLENGGHFVAKILRGGTEGELLSQMKKSFEKVEHYKPPASRKDSSEMYVVARGFKGNVEE